MVGYSCVGGSTFWLEKGLVMESGIQKLDRGLDKDGFIQNLYSPKNIAPEFQEVVSAVVDSLLRELPGQVDGIYL